MMHNVTVTVNGEEYRAHNTVTDHGVTTIRNALISAVNLNSPLKFWLAGTPLASENATPPPTAPEIAGGEPNRTSILWRHMSESRGSDLTPTTVYATLSAATDTSDALFQVEWSDLRNSAGQALFPTLPAEAALTLQWELSPVIGALDNWPTSLSGIGGDDDFSPTLVGNDSQYLQALRNFSRRLLSTMSSSAGEVRIYNDTELDSAQGDPSQLRLEKVHVESISLSADGDAGISTGSFTIPASSSWSPGPGPGRSLTAGTFSYALMVGTDAQALPIAVRGPNVGEGGTFQEAVSALSWGADVSDA